EEGNVLSRTILSFAEGVHLVNEARNSRRKVAFAGKDIAKMSKLQCAVIDRAYSKNELLTQDTSSASSHACERRPVNNTFRYTTVVAILMASLIAVGCAQRVASREEKSMRIPHDPQAKNCYEDLKKIPVFGPGVVRMIDAAQSSESFESRLNAVQNL